MLCSIHLTEIPRAYRSYLAVDSPSPKTLFGFCHKQFVE
jgi:hypothetical protein